MDGEAWGIVLIIFILSLIGGLFVRFISKYDTGRKGSYTNKKRRR